MAKPRHHYDVQSGYDIVIGFTYAYGDDVRVYITDCVCRKKTYDYNETFNYAMTKLSTIEPFCEKGAERTQRNIHAHKDEEADTEIAKLCKQNIRLLPTGVCCYSGFCIVIEIPSNLPGVT
jgi:hypothetical protein